MDKVHRPHKPKRKDLIKVYDVFNSIFKEPKNFYTKEEFDKIKKEKTAI